MKTIFNYLFYPALMVALSCSHAHGMQKSSATERPKLSGYIYEPWKKPLGYDNNIRNNNRTRIIKYEKQADRLGRCFDCTVKMSLGITQDFQKLPISCSMDILTELDFLGKYCEQVESPGEGDIAVYCDSLTDEINHFALVIDPSPDKKKQKCIVASKLGTIPNIYQHNLFDSRFGTHKTNYGTIVSFHRRKNEFVDNKKLLKCLQADIAQSPTIAKTIEHSSNRLLKVCAGRNVTFRKLPHLNKVPPYEKASFLLKNCMGLDVNTRTNHDETPLMLAAARQDTSTIRLLLAMGANKLLEDKDGFTALGIAEDELDYEQKQGNVTIGRYLELQATICALT